MGQKDKFSWKRTNIKEWIYLCKVKELVENCKYFIEYYESVKNKAVLETDVNQNPNYYNN